MINGPLSQTCPVQPGAALKFVIADDHQVVRQGLEVLLSSEPSLLCVGTACSGDEVLPLLESSQPDILLIDLSMPGRPTLELLRQCRRDFPAIGLIVLSMHTLPLTIEEVAKAGAHAFVAKNDTGERLLDTIWRVANGQRGLFPQMPQPDAFALSRREKQVIDGIMHGLSTKEIGERLYLSPKTVELYRTRLLRKFGLAKSTELVRVVLESGIFPVEQPEASQSAECAQSVCAQAGDAQSAQSAELPEGLQLSEALKREQGAQQPEYLQSPEDLQRTENA